MHHPLVMKSPGPEVEQIRRRHRHTGAAEPGLSRRGGVALARRCRLAPANFQPPTPSCADLEARSWKLEAGSWKLTFWNFPASPNEYPAECVVHGAMTDVELEAAPDEALLARIAAGEAAALSVLFRRRQQNVYRFALHLTGSAGAGRRCDAGRVRDRHPGSAAGSSRAGRRCRPGCAGSRATSSAAGWRWIGRRPRRWTTTRSTYRLPATDADPLADLTSAEAIESLRRAVLSLPLRYREVVVLCDLQETSVRGRGCALGCPIGTVRSRLNRGRALLTAKMIETQKQQRQEKPAARQGMTEVPGMNEQQQRTLIAGLERPRGDRRGTRRRAAQSKPRCWRRWRGSPAGARKPPASSRTRAWLRDRGGAGARLRLRAIWLAQRAAGSARRRRDAGRRLRRDSRQRRSCRRWKAARSCGSSSR